MWWWCSSTKGRTNLERFLLGVTPKPPSFSLPQQQGKEEIEYFRLGDLWDCYDELSAYGFGSQVDLNNGETVTQYYVPYLSAIQIQTNKPAFISRNHSEVVESESSECWSDSESEKLLSRSMSNDSSKTWDADSDDSVFDPDGTLLPPREKLGLLDFKYIEKDPPYKRVPLTDKINELAEKYPGLMTLRSVDMSPASWIAVAWYPIYHIPTCKNEKDLTTGFLTYHTLSSSFQDNAMEGDKEETEEFYKESATSKRVPLPLFGLATYKMQGDLWGKTGFDQDRLVYLQSAADSWLKQLNVDHHDYNFFVNSSF
ncbi:unnamed protein product [Cochlearia groenlandica]